MLPITEKVKAMVHEYQCPGCWHGSSPATCEKFELTEISGIPGSDSCFRCEGYCSGFRKANVGAMRLGFPKGFNHIGLTRVQSGDKDHKQERLWPEGAPGWDQFNIPVWARIVGGVLFVRTYCPRINFTYVDVIAESEIGIPEGGTDISEFIDEMD